MRLERNDLSHVLTQIDHQNTLNGGSALMFSKWQEFEDGYLVQVKVPGLSASAFRLVAEGHAIRIIAYYNTSENERALLDLHNQLPAFVKRFALPTDADPYRMEANWQEGVLNILVGKMDEESSAPRFVDIDILD